MRIPRAILKRLTGFALLLAIAGAPVAQAQTTILVPATQETQKVPFAKTKAERLAKSDPRPSLEERYRSHDEYVQIVSAAAAKLVQERYLLPQDADAMIKQAEASDVRR